MVGTVTLPVFLAGLPLKEPNVDGAPIDLHSGISEKEEQQLFNLVCMACVHLYPTIRAKIFATRTPLHLYLLAGSISGYGCMFVGLVCVT